MNGKRIKTVLLVAILTCGLSALAAGQGLVGAPVDPRYGSPAPTTLKPAAKPAAKIPTTVQVALIVASIFRF